RPHPTRLTPRPSVSATFRFRTELPCVVGLPYPGRWPTCALCSEASPTPGASRTGRCAEDEEGRLDDPLDRAHAHDQRRRVVAHHPRPALPHRRARRRGWSGLAGAGPRDRAVVAVPRGGPCRLPDL